MEIGTETAAPERQENQVSDPHVRHPNQGEPCKLWARGQPGPERSVLPVRLIPICTGCSDSIPYDHGYYHT